MARAIPHRQALHKKHAYNRSQAVETGDSTSAIEPSRQRFHIKRIRDLLIIEKVDYPDIIQKSVKSATRKNSEQKLRPGLFNPRPGHAFMRLVRIETGREVVSATGINGMNRSDEIQAATDRIADQVWRGQEPDALSSTNRTVLAELVRAVCPTLIIGEGSAGQGYCLTILLFRTTRQRNRWGGALLQLLS